MEETMNQATVEISSDEVVQFDIEGLKFVTNTANYPIVDEVNIDGDTATVYIKNVEEGMDHNSPPRKLNEEMLQHGYAYIGWSINGVRGDDRHIFEYTTVNTK